jgi:hypothetical protein
MENEEEDKIPPLLRKLKKPAEEQLGDIPEGYFNDFEKRLMQRIAAENEEENKKILNAETPIKALLLKEKPATKTRKLRPIQVISIAASFLLLLVAGTWYLRGMQSSNPFNYKDLMAMDIEKALQGMPMQEADEYLLANVDELETADLLENIAEDEVELILNVSADSLPPLQNKKETKENPTIKTQEPPKQATMKEELEDDLADESDLDDLLKDIDDDDLKALEAALLKPKTEKKGGGK